MRNESKDEDDSHASSDSCSSDHRNNENNNGEGDNNEQDDNNIDEDDHHIVHHCFNCHRRQSTFSQQFGQSYHTEFFQLKSTDVKTRRRFKLCNINDNDPNESHIYCQMYLLGMYIC